ncbi:MAG: AmmeMemoRadiSam system protein B [Candidatus Altiarchaeota archaeon]|nr:AmmeMemoRadiSam system protein B [Candidatus Altiarchaeota archaeon]
MVKNKRKTDYYTAARNERIRRHRAHANWILIIGLLAVFAVSIYIITHPLKGSTPTFPTTTTAEKPAIPAIVKKPAVSGTFYPEDANQLRSLVDGYIEKALPLNLPRVRGLVSPHAGYAYSASVAAYGYRQIKGGEYKTVIIAGPSHYVAFNGFSIPNATLYETPLGNVTISQKAFEMMKEPGFVSDESIHQKEHSVESQIPLLQRTLQDFTIIPIVVGDMSPDDLAALIEKYMDDDTLVIASSDLSHYHPYADALRLDGICTKAIPSFDYENMEQCELCGRTPVLALMKLAEKQGWNGQLLDYKNSGDVIRDRSNVVGYSSIAFTEGFTDEEKDYLLALSRRTLETYVKYGTKAEPTTEIPPRLKQVQGCFTTLNENSQLRGCIGHITPQEPLYSCVIDNTISAAARDMRFKPVTESELSEITIEISVLSVPKKLEYSSSEDLKNKLVPLTDGVVLKSGQRSATYLPQVWEQLPDKEEFLTSLCKKAGLPADCWKNNPEISTYRAQVFTES